MADRGSQALISAMSIRHQAFLQVSSLPMTPASARRTIRALSLGCCRSTVRAARSTAVRRPDSRLPWIQPYVTSISRTLRQY